MKTNGKALTGELVAVIERVRKLVALGESKNVHEAEVALAKANEILIKHKLSMGDLVDLEAKAQQERVNPVGRENVKIEHNTIHTSKTMWVQQLADVLAQHHFSRALFGRSYVLFIGRKEDTDVATYLFTVLRRNLIELAAEAKAKYVADFRAEYGVNPNTLSGMHHPMTWQYSWLTGAVAGLASALRKVRTAYEQAAGMQALVVRSGQELDTYVADHFPKLKQRAASKATLNYNAWDAGVKVGMALKVPGGLPGRKAETPKGITAPK